jgi:hypothetical protein
MPASSAPRAERRPRWGLRLALLFVALPVALFALWTFVSLQFSYSEGDRTGYAQKLSRRGWVCKTWEGELAISNVPGQAAELFRYSVRDDAVVRQIQALQGQRVTLTYAQHVGVPTTCFGETQYYATAVRPAAAAEFPALPGYPAGARPGAPAAPAAPAAPGTPAAPAAPAAPAPR